MWSILIGSILWLTNAAFNFAAKDYRAFCINLSKDTPYHFKRNWKAAKLLLLLLTASVWTITVTLAEPAPVTVTGRPEESVSGPEYAYNLSGVHEVDGRQGVAWEDSYFYISGSTTLTRYDADWNLITAAIVMAMISYRSRLTCACCLVSAIPLKLSFITPITSVFYSLSPSLNPFGNAFVIFVTAT